MSLNMIDINSIIRALKFSSYNILLFMMILFISCEKRENVAEVETLQILEITDVSAKAEGNISSAGTNRIIEKGFCWSKDPNPVKDDGFVSSSDIANRFFGLISGLSPDTWYYVRAYAQGETDISYGNEVSFKTLAAGENPQIIADHTVVEKYDDIPQNYINKVKEQWLVYAGESHSAAIRRGLILLEELNSVYQVNVIESGTPEGYTSSYLRASRAIWGNYENSSGWIYSYGEEDWYTNSTALARTKAGITYCNTHGLEIGAIGYGWCWDPHIDTPGEFTLYTNATDQYVSYCREMGYSTKVFYTTGTVDMYFEGVGYAKHLGYEMIREHVRKDPSRILFDYADILCYDEGSEVPNTTTWEGNEYPIITPTNLGTTGIGHIGTTGAIRLAKAMWWMLARMEGWDGESK